MLLTGGGYRHNLLNPSEFEITIGKRVLNNELVIDGTIPVFSANVTEPFGYTDKLLITDFSRDSVLWGIDGDWMVNFWHKNQPFYPTDHCGVLRVLTDKINPRYMAYLLEKEGKRAGFSRSYRASIDRVQGISVTVPDITIQNQTVEKVLAYEKKIAELEKSMQALNGKRAEIIQQYLQ